MDSFFQRALPYIEMGWQVFPTRPDKIPLCKHGRNDATCVSLTIEAWSDEFPDANVSIKTGEASGVCVIDIDSENGEQWIASVNSSWAKLPETAIALSGRGRHLYFAYPKIVPVKSADGKLARGIDLKAAGGSITAPISLHASGKLYEWVIPPFGRQLPTLPMWIVKALSAEVRPARKSSLYEGMPPTNEHIQRLLGQVASATEGTRNHTLNRISFIFGLMVKDGHLTEGQALNYLVEAGVNAGLSRFEAGNTVRSGIKAGRNTAVNRNK